MVWVPLFDHLSLVKFEGNKSEFSKMTKIKTDCFLQNYFCKVCMGEGSYRTCLKFNVMY